MISALDTNVILDVLHGDQRFGQLSLTTLRRSSAEGGLIVSTVVWAEVCAAFEDAAEATRVLGRMAAEFVADDPKVAELAGRAWRLYRRAGGTRRRVLADFLVGAHALANADRLVTRDRGFYRTYFEGLTILDPTTGGRP